MLPIVHFRILTALDLRSKQQEEAARNEKEDPHRLHEKRQAAAAAGQHQPAAASAFDVTKQRSVLNVARNKL